VSLDQLLESSKECSPLKLTEEQIEIIRSSERCSLDKVAIGVGVGVGLGLPIFIVALTVLLCLLKKSKHVHKGVEQDRLQTCTDAVAPWLLLPLALPIFLPLLLLCPWRLVFLTISFMNQPEQKISVLLYLAGWQTILAALDVLSVPAVILGVALIAPAYRLIKGVSKSTSDLMTTLDLHSLVWVSLVVGFRDMIFWAVLLPLCLTAPWRFVIAIRESCIVDKPIQRRTSIMRQLILAFLDLASLPALVFCALVPWRWIGIADKVNKDTAEVRDGFQAVYPDAPEWPWNRVILNTPHPHSVIWMSALMVFYDYFSLLAAIVTILMPHRAVMLLATIVDPELPAQKRNRAALSAFCLILLDLVTILPSLVVLSTIYRAPSLFHRTFNQPALFLSSVTGNSPWIRTLWSYRYHREVWLQFLRLLVDIGVFLPMFLVCCLAPHRLAPLIIDLCRSGWTQRDRRWLILKNFGLVWADFGTLPLAAVLLVTVYRIPSLVRRAKQNILEWGSMEKATSEIVALEAEDNPGCTRSHSCVASRLSASIHRAIAFEFLNLLGDLLPIFVAPLTMIAPWRAISTVYAFSKSNSTKERRLSVVINVFMAFLDLIHVPITLIVVVSGYRIPTLAEHWGKTSRKTSGLSLWGSALRSPAPNEAFYILFHSMGLYRGAWRAFGSLLLDIPAILMFLCSIIAPWRFALIIYDFFKVSCIGNIAEPAANRRRAAALHFFCAICDLLHLPIVLVSLAPVYRIPQMVRRFHEMEVEKPKGGCCGFTDVDGKTLTRTQMEMSPAMRSIHTWYIYGIFWRHAMLLVADIGVILMLCATLAVPWRAIIAFRGIMASIQRDDPMSTTYSVAFLQFVYAILDILVAPLFFFLFIQPYRLISFFMEFHISMKSDVPLSQVRYSCQSTVSLVFLKRLLCRTWTFMAPSPFTSLSCGWTTCRSFLVSLS
jgi:hypothetical protein